MAISKRLRYEILRRDGHRCRYCGAGVSDVALTGDHVTAVALVGAVDILTCPEVDGRGPSQFGAAEEVTGVIVGLTVEDGVL